MGPDALTQAVRQQLRLGRLLALGGPDDGTWITEQAAGSALRAAAAVRLPGLRLDTLHLSPVAAPPAATAPAAEASPAGAPAGGTEVSGGEGTAGSGERLPAVPPPPTALPPGPLRIEAGFAAPAGEPLPAVAEQLRTVLLTTADRELGLPVRRADLEVTALLDAAGAAPAQEQEPEPDGPGDAETEAETGAGAGAEAGAESAPEEGEVTRAVRAVPGVTRTAPALGGLFSREAVTVTDGGETGHVLVQIAVAAGQRAPDVAGAVRKVVTKAATSPGRRVTVAVLITAVDDGTRRRQG